MAFLALISKTGQSPLNKTKCNLYFQKVVLKYQILFDIHHDIKHPQNPGKHWGVL